MRSDPRSPGDLSDRSPGDLSHRSTSERQRDEEPAAPHDHHHAVDRIDTAADWDERYRSEGERMWSGEPNGLLVAELGPETSRRILDVGCGEGADAVWLASRGWDVTAIDVSGVAIERARAAAEAAGVRVAFHAADFTAADLGTYAVVSSFYPALPKADGRALEALLGAVEPGGTLLFCHHADVDPEHARERGYDPADYVGLDDVAAAVADRGWDVVLDETRKRDVTGGAGAHHRLDRVIRAVKP
ncbi:hypothetical protein GCM10027418_23060 [Mariniluteicoccus endophyticus]